MNEIKLNPVEEVVTLTEKALVAFEKFKEIKCQKKVDEIVEAATKAAIDNHVSLAEFAVKETGRGVVADKVTKNFFTCDSVPKSIKELKTVGIVARDEEQGTIAIADPVGVICGIVPTTNPTSTTIFKILIALKTRNPIIFSFHPAANECSKETARILHKAAVEAGAPENCVQFLETPTLEGTDTLMNSDAVSVILATGGSAMVRAAYSCGKPALGVGPGNVPAYVHKDANLEQVVDDIVLSKSFDNGMICASEQAAIVDEEIYEDFTKRMKEKKVYFVTKEDKTKLENLLFGVEANSEGCGGARLNATVIGQSAVKIAELAGVKVPEDALVLAVECEDVGENEPLTREKLSPVLAVVKSLNKEDGIEKAARMIKLNGRGHTAAVHSESLEVVEQFGLAIESCRILWNQPATFGAIGGLYNTLMPSMTLGCGSFGRNSVAGNISAPNLLNIKLIASRKTE